MSVARFTGSGNVWSTGPGVARETRLPPATFYHRYAVKTCRPLRGLMD